MTVRGHRGWALILLASLVACGSRTTVVPGDAAGTGTTTTTSSWMTGTTTTSSQPCSDLGSDPKNCGACGHDCQGGACQAGICQPVVLATGFDVDVAIFDIAFDTTSVYVLSGGVLSKVPKAGGAPAKLASPGGTAIAVSGGVVYVAATNDLGSVSTQGGSVGVLAKGASPWDVATNGVDVYFTSWLYNALGLSVERIPVAGGPISVLWSEKPDPQATYGYAWVVVGKAAVYCA